MVSFPHCFKSSVPACFHAHSGYDFGYLLKLLTGEFLQYSEDEFYTLLGLFFPQIYDIKCLMKSVKLLKGGLQDVADALQVRCKALWWQCSAGSSGRRDGV